MVSAIPLTLIVNGILLINTSNKILNSFIRLIKVIRYPPSRQTLNIFVPIIISRVI